MVWRWRLVQRGIAPCRERQRRQCGFDAAEDLGAFGHAGKAAISMLIHAVQGGDSIGRIWKSGAPRRSKIHSLVTGH